VRPVHFTTTCNLVEEEPELTGIGFPVGPAVSERFGTGEYSSPDWRKIETTSAEASFSLRSGAKKKSPPAFALLFVKEPGVGVYFDNRVT